MIRLVTCLFLFCLVVGCAKPTTRAPTVTSSEIEHERQKQLELAHHVKLEQQEKQLKTAAVMTARLADVAPKITKAAVRYCGMLQDFDGLCVYGFKLIESDDINAYADGRTIYVTSGMMKFAKTDDALALVLGHEVAHNLMGHIDASKQNALIGGLVGSVLDAAAKTQGIDTHSSFSRGGSYLGQLHYSKAFETEADYVGLYITAIAGFGIDGAPAFWRRMSVKHPDGIYLATTHPSHPERFVTLEKTVSEIKQKQKQAQPLIPDLIPKE